MTTTITTAGGNVVHSSHHINEISPLCIRPARSVSTGVGEQESCAIAKITVRCANKSKQTATPPPKIT